MPPANERHDRPGKTSRRGILKGAAALAASAPALGQARQNRGNLAGAPILAYVGAYSSPQGPEGSKGNGQGIYLVPNESGYRGSVRARDLFG